MTVPRPLRFPASALGALALAAVGLLSQRPASVLAASSPPEGGGLPVLDQEPILGVWIARAPRIEVTLMADAHLKVDGSTRTLPSGTVSFEATPDGGWRIAGGSRVVRSTGVLASGGHPIFELDATPPFGAPRSLLLSGDLFFSVEGGALEVVEHIAMEDYLVGVVAAEMDPSWPPAALAAQAIVARSYAAARWMERHDDRWQLNWHFAVDMAYHGVGPGRESIERAVAATRGEVLVYRGWPVLALFNASSGGRTEAFDHVKPGIRAPDGRTPIAPAMPVVDDPAAIPGATGLGLADSHGRWKSDLPLPEVSAGLQRWSKEAWGRPHFGTVEGVSVLERYGDSGRVARVNIRHRLDGATLFTALPAADFRMAVSPVRIRSLLWDRCVIASREPGYLVLEGRGFGHGCGLSQVSAWYLASRGASAEYIVARFYAGARIERRY